MTGKIWRVQRSVRTHTTHTQTHTQTKVNNTQSCLWLKGFTITLKPKWDQTMGFVNSDFAPNTLQLQTVRSEGFWAVSPLFNYSSFLPWWADVSGDNESCETSTTALRITPTFNNHRAIYPPLFKQTLKIQIWLKSFRDRFVLPEWHALTKEERMENRGRDYWDQNAVRIIDEHSMRCISSVAAWTAVHKPFPVITLNSSSARFICPIRMCQGAKQWTK